jgi:hypothetical protein
MHPKHFVVLSQVILASEVQFPSPKQIFNLKHVCLLDEFFFLSINQKRQLEMGVTTP